jgi:conjugative transfer signal peptidase TraF
VTASQLARLYMVALAVTVCAAVAVSWLASHLIYNATPSMPLGFYWVTPRPAFRRDDVVAFHIPPAVAGLVHERQYLPARALLLKPVIATAGDDVCTTGGVLRVNGTTFGNLLRHDSAGRPLPQDTTCHPLATDEVFVASPHPQSFDSRTFGAVPVDAIVGKVVPLWTY